MSWQKRRSPEKLYNWYDDRVERREWCKLASPLGHRTQPWLSPASESSHPLRFRATQASTPDRDADCESCVAPDSPNLSIAPFKRRLRFAKVQFDFERLRLSQWRRQRVTERFRERSDSEVASCVGLSLTHPRSEQSRQNCAVYDLWQFKLVQASLYIVPEVPRSLAQERSQELKCWRRILRVRSLFCDHGDPPLSSVDDAP